MKIFFIIISFAAATFFSFSKDCTNHTQFKKGSVITQTSYDENNKVTGTTKATCISIAESGAALIATMKSEGFDKSGKVTSTGEFTVTCSNGKISMDLKSMVAPKHAPFFMKGATMQATGDKLEIPEKPEVGQTLPDAKVKMNMMKGDKSVGSMDITIKNRKVAAKENITSPAGTFECFKITYDIESTNIKVQGIRTKEGYKSTAKAAMWYNVENGAIKTLANDEKGALAGYTLVTAIKK